MTNFEDALAKVKAGFEASFAIAPRAAIIRRCGGANGENLLQMAAEIDALQEGHEEYRACLRPYAVEGKERWCVALLTWAEMLRVGPHVRRYFFVVSGADPEAAATEARRVFHTEHFKHTINNHDVFRVDGEA